MQVSSNSETRRSFLRNWLLAPVAGALAQEQQYRITPKTSAEHRHDAADDTPSSIKQALQRKVTTLQGFDPLGFLTAFDYGQQSRLSDGRVLREYKIVARDAELEIAPGVIFPAWTYNGNVPGPTIRCREGDLVRLRFSNQSLSEHTIHLHGIHAAIMDGVVEIVRPGQSYTYEFIAEPFGLQFYHCHVPPIGLHMNRGLFGALIIDPPTPRAKAREMVMIAHGWDVDFDNKNELYAVNGPANFYRDNPIQIRVGELVRIYLINALEFDPINSFHLHANFFKVYRTGSKLTPDDYTDLVTLSQAERCIVEFAYALPGSYMFHAHQNNFAEAGWMGHFEVSA